MLVLGTAGDDMLVDGPEDNHLRGLDGDDVLEDVAGDNILDGGQGDDVLVSGTGSDTFVFRPGDGNDQVPQADLTITDHGSGTSIEAPNGASFWLIDVSGAGPEHFTFL